MEKDTSHSLSDQKADTSRDGPNEMDGICVVCHQNYIDHSQNTASRLCSDCRSQLIKLRMPKWVIAFFVVIGLVIASSFKTLPAELKDYKEIRTAQIYAKEKQYADAIELYKKITDKYSASNKLAIDYLDACMNQQDFQLSYQIIDSRLIGKELNEDDYNKVQGYMDLIENMMEASTAANEMLNGIDWHKANAPLEALEKLKQIDETRHDKAYLLYLRAQLQTNPEEAVKLYEQAYQLQPKYTFILAYLGNVQRYGGNVKKAEETYQNALSINKTDAMAIRGLAVLDLLRDNKERGLELAKQAYSISPFFNYVPDTVVIALKENGKVDDAFEFLKQNEQAGYTFASDLQDYLSGKVTLKQYFIKS